MEFVIGLGIGIVVAAFLGRTKKRRDTINRHPPVDTDNETPSERKQRETDELITVVLPTIGQDK